MIDATGPAPPRTGDTVVSGFRGQAFGARACAVGIAGVPNGSACVVFVGNIFGQAEPWPHLHKRTP